MAAAIRTVVAACPINPFAAETCCLVGPEDGQPTCEHARRFDHLNLIARLRGHLEGMVSSVTSEFRALDIPPTAEGLYGAMLIRVSKARPRSRIVPWHLPDSIVESMARKIAHKVAGEVGR